MSNRTSSSFVVELRSPAALDSSIVGSKAASVANLVGQGATVPSGFIIPASVFADFIAPIKRRISTILDSVDVENPASSFEAADAIRKLVGAQTMPDGLATAVFEKLSDFPSEFGLAVRSSGTAEDLEGASFAGMYETFLDATEAESVTRRVRDVWISYYNGRAISYRERQNIPHESGSMAVLIMQLVNAEAGGVLFTRDPRDGTDQILINAALGLGEGVVSGEAQADSFTLNSESLEITNRNVLDKEWMFVSGVGGSTDRVPVPAENRSAPALTDAQLIATAKAALAIKAASGDDRDIEFAVVGETIHILQSRPVTTGEKKETEFPVEWDNPEDEKRHWQTGGKPTPMFPLVADSIFMAGVAQKRSVDMTGNYMGRHDLKKWVNGYMYSAASDRDPEETKATLFKHHLQGRRYLENKTTFFDEEVKPVLLANVEKTERARPDINTPIPMHVAFLREAMQLGADHMSDLHWRSWGGFDSKKNDLGELFAEIMGKSEVEASDLVLGTEHMTARLTRRLISMSALVRTDPWLANIFATRDYQTLFKRGGGERPAVRTFRNRFRSMMKIWGCRNGIGYGTAWKPTDPTWDMKPEIPLDSIGSYARQDLDAAGRSRSSLIEKRDAAIREVHKKIGRNAKLRKKFDFEVYRAMKRVQIMENHNYWIEQRTYGIYRESINGAGTALTNGGWIDAPDDIFYLRLAQLDAAVAANDYSNLRSQVIQSKEQFDVFAKLERPEFLGTKPDEEDKDKDEEKPLQGLSEDGQTVHGDPSSAGSFTGTARVVITRTSTPPNVRKGDILVTENTGPDWVPVFPLLGGLVLDKGDNFQHASLIAREYGIPCVIQTQVGTEKIDDGQTITIDGTAGTVTLNPIG
jgi:rifampicin phosphotransferase